MIKNDIIQELNNLGSSLAHLSRENVYTVPLGYFDSFEQTLQNIVWISSLPKACPYQVPTDYFDQLAEHVMKAIRNHPDYQTSQEEISSISPLLGSLNRRPVYSVPEGYFANLQVGESEGHAMPNVISLNRRRWFRYAAAAVIVAVVALTGLMIYNGNSAKHSDAAGKAPLANFEKEVKKIDDLKSTESLIDFMDAGLNEKALASNRKATKSDDVQQLLKDIPTDELKEFSEQSKDIEDVMMTN
ncbi:MAG TPA: hypothetical protein VFP87_14220 [Chitinophagaceae bacterium]|nr:hypothetical protein [Chitinophagaceae bacterium]